MKRLLGSYAQRARPAKIGYVLLWLLGVPLPILLLIYVLRGCN
jgi:hypothetical protein